MLSAARPAHHVVELTGTVVVHPGESENVVAIEASAIAQMERDAATRERIAPFITDSIAALRTEAERVRARSLKAVYSARLDAALGDGRVQAHDLPLLREELSTRAVAVARQARRGAARQGSATVATGAWTTMLSGMSTVEWMAFGRRAEQINRPGAHILDYVDLGNTTAAAGAATATTAAGMALSLRFSVKSVMSLVAAHRLAGLAHAVRTEPSIFV